ncbi:fibronectin type III domain-containing protein [Actinoplanes sp. TFC3]|uniref:fibronectin type III domain-containing protein n=1 Tax=Actinoplanes sp. TFC3 TaxID=1710355 RepID=UPI00137A3C7A|nr:fibronectin type III domain-containing protein [Actinoplanes sp. TFC3]
MTPDGTLSVFAGTGTCGASTAGAATASMLNKPINLAIDSQDNVYVAQDTNGKVDKISSAGVLSAWAGAGPSGAIVEGPATASPMRVFGMVFDAQDNLYLGDWVRGYILKVDSSDNLTIFAGNGNTTTVTPGPARQSGMRGLYGLAFDSQQNLYATDLYLFYVYKITPAGILSIFAGNGTNTSASTAGPATSSALKGPWGLATDAADNVYVSINGAPSVVSITPAGTLTVIAGTGATGTTTPGLATATPLRSITSIRTQASSVYYADPNGNRVNRLFPASAPSAPTNLQITPGAGSISLSFDPPSSTGGTAVTSYEVSTDGGTTWNTLTTSGTGPITGTVTGLTNGQSYSVAVRAVNAIGTGPASGAQTANLPAVAPSAPTGLAADARNGAAELTFSVPDNGGAAITSYDVSLDDGTTWQTLPVTGSGATRTATVSGLTNNQQYTVRVRAVNSVGAGAASANTTVTPAPGAPVAPGAVSVTRGDSSATVTFNPPSDNGGSLITSYEVSTDNGVTWSALSTTGSSPVSGTVTGLTNGQAYDVRVRAVNSAGPGTASGSVSVTPATTPGAPGNFSVSRGDSSATVSFDPPSGTGGNAITSYEVSTDNGVTWSALSTTGSSPVSGTVTGLTNGQAYDVRVRAVNSAGPGTASGSVSVTPATTPGAPGNFSVSRGDSSATVSFDPPSGTGGNAITSYEVSTDNGVTWSALSTTGSSPVSGTVTGLTNGQAYDVRVRAVNGVGPGSASTSAGVTPAATPGAPSGLQVSRGDQSASVTFSVPASTGGDPITSYEVSTDDGATWSSLPVSGTGATRTATVSQLTNGQLYQIKVRARNSVGPGASSAPSEVRPARAPDAPANITVQPAGNGKLAVTFVPAGDNGDAVTHYEISTDNGTSWQTVATQAGPSGKRIATVTGLTNGTTYPVQVRAVNTAGASTASAAVPGTPAADAPSAPGALSASPGDGSATLSFAAPADDGGSAVTGYELSLDGGDTWRPLSTTGAGPNLRATLLGLTNGTAYSVKIRARNPIGAGAASAAVSFTPSATPATAPGAPSAVTATPGDRTAVLAFFPPAQDGGAPITGYEVSVNDGAWTGLDTTAGSNGTRTATLTGLTNGTVYGVRLRAINSVGAGVSTAAITVTPASPLPGAPTGLTVSPGDAALTVSFNRPDYDGADAIVRYEVSTDDGITWALLTTTSGADGRRTATVTTLVNGTTYPVRIRAVNGSGAGPASPSVAGTPAAVTVPVRIDLQLQLTTDTKLLGARATLTGGGLMPSSTYLLRMFSAPVVIASGRTNSLGGFRSAITMPRKACVAGGLHQLVLTGTAPDGTIVRDINWVVLDDTCSAHTGTTTKPPAGTVRLGSYLFPYQSSRLLLTTKRNLRASVGSLRGAKLVTVTGYTQTDKTSKAARAANRRLALQRAVAVRQYLRGLGVRTAIRVVGAGATNPTSKNQNLNRRVVISIRY